MKRGTGSLEQTATATGVDITVAGGINLAGLQRIAWTNQTENLTQAVLKYGEK
ncbi:hypothetical protein [Arthrobacter ramosus]|uniref:hypothetical protein n=1 Tax=Arthrobacter ramosus TaxID=1672 RepID=UPI002FEC33C9